MPPTHRYALLFLALSLAPLAGSLSCGADESDETFDESEFEVKECKGLPDPALEQAKIRLSPGENRYAVDLKWAAPKAKEGDRLRLEVSEHSTGHFSGAMDSVKAQRGHA